MRVKDLFSSLTDAVFSPSIDNAVTINRLQLDSRLIQPGDLFISFPCDQDEAYIRSALEKGASCVLVQQDCEQKVQKITDNLITIPDVRKAASDLATRFYSKQPPTLATVTGTNGKSSVIHFLSHLWETAQLPWGNFGTIGLYLSPRFSQDKQPKLSMPSLTTADALSFHKLLNELAGEGVTHFAFETSSHGLDQKRVHGARLKAAAFTNLTQDHLDYHQTMENYLEAKLKLFSEVLGEGNWAVLNGNSPYFPRFKTTCEQRKHNILTYGLSSGSSPFDIQADNLTPNCEQPWEGTRIDLKIKDQQWHQLNIPLIGAFQIENALAAAGLALACGMNIESIVKSLKTMQQVPGRLELVGVTPSKGSVYVDYAHTPDALETILKTLRPYTKNKLYVVFGCGGNRDTTKRPLMGEIAHKFSDVCIITDDNPRYEDPALIRQQIKAACPNAIEKGDRFEAMQFAINSLVEGDILVICGKGHEQGQIIGNNNLPFDDRQKAKDIIKLLSNY